MAEAGAAHAALVERASALIAEVQRLEEGAAELETRERTLATEVDETRRRVGALRAAIVAGQAQLDADVRALDGLRQRVQSADDAVSALRISTDQHEEAIKEARHARSDSRNGGGVGRPACDGRERSVASLRFVSRRRAGHAR